MARSKPAASTSKLRQQVAQALRRTQDYFFDSQHPDGYWWGELESNPTMEAEYLMLTYFLDSDEGERWKLVANDIRRRQRDDGTWGMYYGAPGDLSTTVECYFALKLMGVSADEPLMRSARNFILSKGGVPKVRIFTKIWLALFGQWEWKGDAGNASGAAAAPHLGALQPLPLLELGQGHHRAHARAAHPAPDKVDTAGDGHR